MAIPSWLRKVFASPTSTARPPAPRRRRRALTLECLEGRLVPATFNVANGDTAGLIAAINTSNTNNQDNYIYLTAHGTYTFNTVNNYWFGPNALPPISNGPYYQTIIVGGGATLQRSSTAPALRFFYVSGGLSGLQAGNLYLDSLTLSGGLAQGGAGGNNGGGGGGAGMGGAIFNQGGLYLDTVTLRNNAAVGGDGGDPPVNIAGGGGGMGSAGASGYFTSGGVGIGGMGGGFGSSLGATYGGNYGSGGGGVTTSGGGGGGGGFLPGANGGNGYVYGGGAGGGLGGFGGNGGTSADAGPGGQGGDGGGGGAAYGHALNGGSSGGSFGNGGLGSLADGGAGGGGVGGGGGGGYFSPGGGGGFGGGGGSATQDDGGSGGFGGGGGDSTSGGGGSGGFGGGAGKSGVYDTTSGYEGGAGGGAGMGGAVFNFGGSINILSSTLAGNTAQGGSGSDGKDFGIGHFSVGGDGGSGLGGALFNLDGQVNIWNSTLAGNNVVAGSAGSLHNPGFPGSAEGGAVYNLAYGNNLSTGGPVSSSLSVSSSILANSAGGPDLTNNVVNGKGVNTATLTATDHNLIESRTIRAGTFSGTPLTADPALSPLADHGGYTPTMLPLPGSPVLGEGSNPQNLGYDQRGDGFFRTVNGTISIGAVEPQATTTSLSSSGSSTYGSSVTFTAQVSSPDLVDLTGGSVQFCFGSGILLGTTTLSKIGSQFVATCTSAALSAGTDSVYAVYGGPGCYPGSTSSTISQTVNKAVLTVTADNKSRTYGSANPAFTATITGFQNGENLATSGVSGSPALTTTAGSASPVGGYAIVPAVGTLAANNYSFGFANGTLTVTKATPTLTVTGGTFTYDANPHAATAAVVGVLGESLGSASITYSPPGPFGGPPVNAGSYSASGAFGGNQNYVSATGAAAITIAPKAASVSPNAAGKTYGDMDPLLGGTLSGFLAADAVKASYTRAPGETVLGGPYMISATLSSPGGLANYAITYNTAPFTIAPLSITVAPDLSQYTKVYGDPDPAVTYHITSGSLINGDTLSGALSRAAGANVGAYAITIGNLSAGPNYAVSLSGPPVVLTITARPITVTADAKTKVYSNSDPALTYSVTGGSLVSGDSFAGALTRATGTNIGAYPIQQGSLTAGGNYALTYVGANLTITPRPITITPASGEIKWYGDQDPPWYWSSSESPDNGFTGNISRVAGENAGSYAMTLGNLSAGPNYTVSLSSTPVSFNILKRELDVRPNAQTKVYGGSDPALTYQIIYGSLINGDTLSGALNRASGENVGAYAIQPGTLTAGPNYAFGFAPGSNLTITPAALTVTADDKSKDCGDSNPALTYTIRGFVNNDSASVVSGTPTLNTTAAAGSPVGYYPISIDVGPLSAANYTFQGVNGTLSVVAPVTVAAVRVNDGSAQRSEVRSITVTFSGPVIFAGGNANAAAAFQLLHVQTGNNVGLNAVLSTDAQGRTVVTLSFSGDETDAVSALNGGIASLADGRYSLSVLAGSVTDANGGALDGDADGQVGGNYVSPTDTYQGNGLHLYRLFGDTNGDGVVDATDVGQLKSTFNRNNVDPLYLSFLDADNSGAVDAQDIAQFKSRFNVNVFG
jgi:hypothetical protein